MTPDAVIHRYLQLIAQPSIDFRALCDLIGTDADLLARWLRLLDCPADLNELHSRISAMSAHDFGAIARAQAWFVLPIVGSARLSLDQWLSVLKAACLAEALHDEGAATESAARIRTRALLALSGVNLTTDPRLGDLIEYRGINPVLLEDATPELKAFAVADGLETGREAELALQLLRLDGDQFAAKVAQAEARVAELTSRAGIDLDEDADWAQRIWLRQQVSIACACFDEAQTLREFLAAHAIVSRTLFNSVPEILLIEPAGLTATTAPNLVINPESVTSLVAQALRVGQPLPISDAPDLAVIDRQVLRAIEATEGIAMPLRLERPIGVLMVRTDEDVDVEFAAALYAEEVVKWFDRKPETAAEHVLPNEIEAFREAEMQRLREIVHEANNPLSIVHNYMHILELRLKDDAEIAEQLDMIAQELRRAGDVIATVRDVPSSITPPLPVVGETDEFDLLATVRRIGELHRGYALERSVHIEVATEGAAEPIHSDEAKLTQVLSNLVKNAIEACAAGDTIHLRTRGNVYREGRRGVEIVVEDTGPGIDEDVLAVLFEPKETKKGGDHQGLGLHLTHRLIGELSGSLDVHTAPGQGTEFHVFLPASD